MKNFTIGQEVVRSKGDYVVGRTGIILEWVGENKCQVQWNGKHGKSKVSIDVIEPVSDPYEIIPGKNIFDNKGRYIKHTYPKYVKK